MQWQIAFTVVVYPCLILAYMGEAAFLSQHKREIQRSFYSSITEDFCFSLQDILADKDRTDQASYNF